MKHLKDISLALILAFTFFIGLNVTNAGVPKKEENLIRYSESAPLLEYLFAYDCKLDKEFNKYTFEYDLICSPNTDKVKLTYRAASVYSTVSVDNVENLTNGSIITLTVTAKEGKSYDYKLMMRYSNSKLLYTILVVVIIIILILAIAALVLYILWKKGIIKFEKKEKENIGNENYVN